MCWFCLRAIAASTFVLLMLCLWSGPRLPRGPAGSAGHHARFQAGDAVGRGRRDIGSGRVPDARARPRGNLGAALDRSAGRTAGRDSHDDNRHQRTADGHLAAGSGVDALRLRDTLAVTFMTLSLVAIPSLAARGGSIPVVAIMPLAAGLVVAMSLSITARERVPPKASSSACSSSCSPAAAAASICGAVVGLA